MQSHLSRVTRSAVLASMALATFPSLGLAQSSGTIFINNEQWIDGIRSHSPNRFTLRPAITGATTAG
jgi:hypothetical protein